MAGAVVHETDYGPAGKVTGVAQLTREVAPKRLELAHELVPNATVSGLLINPKNPTSENVARDLQAAAVAMGLRLNVLCAGTEVETDGAFTTCRQIRAPGTAIVPWAN